MPLPITPHTTGWHDDGLESGVLRTSVERGNAIFVPYEANESTISVNNSIYGKNYTQDLANGKGMKVVSAASATLLNPCEAVYNTITAQAGWLPAVVSPN